MKAKHTPGPWYQHDEKGRRFIETIDGEVICTMSSRPLKPANGLLIAAAPELLHVAMFMLRGMEGGHIKCAGYLDFDPDAESLEIKQPSDMLRAAIAKATGTEA